MSVARDTNNKVYLTISPKPCGKVSSEIGASDDIFCLARAPVTSSKRPILSAYFRLARGARGTLREDGEPRGPQPWHPLPPMGTTSWPNMTPVISPRQHSYLYSNGVTTTIPSNPSLRKSERPCCPSSTTQRRTGQSVATARSTSRRRGQKINACHISALQENRSTG
jgi:hypothetical protein